MMPNINAWLGMKVEVVDVGFQKSRNALIGEWAKNSVRATAVHGAFQRGFLDDLPAASSSRVFQ
jgi:hypothetical protein